MCDNTNCCWWCKAQLADDSSPGTHHIQELRQHSIQAYADMVWQGGSSFPHQLSHPAQTNKANRTQTAVWSVVPRSCNPERCGHAIAAQHTCVGRQTGSRCECCQSVFTDRRHAFLGCASSRSIGELRHFLPCIQTAKSVFCLEPTGYKAHRT